MNKIASIIMTLGLIIALGIIFFGKENSNSEPAQNVEIKNGIQYVTVVAKGGYSQNVSTAQAEIPTKLIMKTNGAYDCSASLVIRSIGYQKILPQTGKEVIDLGTPKAGQLFQGVCNMGMYSFKINFI